MWTNSILIKPTIEKKERKTIQNIKNVGKDEAKNTKRMDWTHTFKI